MKMWKNLFLSGAALFAIFITYRIWWKSDKIPPGQYRVTYPHLAYSGAASSLTVGSACKKSCREGRVCGDLDGSGNVCHRMCDPEAEKSTCKSEKVCGSVIALSDPSREVIGGVCTTPF